MPIKTNTSVNDKGLSETKIKVFSIIMTILYTILLIYFENVVLFILLTIILVSIIYFDIGLFKRKYSYMKQFVKILLIYIVIEGIVLIPFCLICLIVTINDKEYSDFVSIAMFICFVGIPALYAFQIYYYQSILSYVHLFTEELKNTKEIRKLENNEK